MNLETALQGLMSLFVKQIKGGSSKYISSIKINYSTGLTSKSVISSLCL